MRVEILERIGFEPRTQTPGTVLSVPGDATPIEAEDWLARGLVRVVEDAHRPEPPPDRSGRRKQ